MLVSNIEATVTRPAVRMTKYARLWSLNSGGLCQNLLSCRILVAFTGQVGLRLALRGRIRSSQSRRMTRMGRLVWTMMAARVFMMGRGEPARRATPWAWAAWRINWERVLYSRPHPPTLHRCERLPPQCSRSGKQNSGYFIFDTPCYSDFSKKQSN